MERQVNGQDRRGASQQGMAMQTIRHELRTPVNHIIGFSEMLLEEASDLELPGRYDALQHVVVSGRQILAAITEILAGSGIAVREADLLALHSRIAPYLGEIDAVCAELIAVAEGEERPQFAADLRKIAAAASQLERLSSGACRHPTRPRPPRRRPRSAAPARISSAGTCCWSTITT